MGVRNLNTYLQSHCKTGISTIPLSLFSHKKLVVDTSIYMYRYKAMELLIPNMIRLITMFQSLSITPIFVFDGAPKINKQALLKKRRNQKRTAWLKYKDLTSSASPDLIQELKNQFTVISKEDVTTVKSIMDSMHIQYIDAPHEADEVCAKMAVSRQVHACVSDDTDMLLYGCSMVVRSIDLETKSALLYKLNSILKSVNMTYTDLKIICVLAGTDYYSTHQPLFHYIKLYREYQQTRLSGFYEWLIQKKHISPDKEFQETMEVFTLGLESPSESVGSYIAVD